MRKSFLSLAIVAILMTMITTLRSDNDTYNEDTSRKTYYHWKKKIWKVIQSCSDSEDSLATYAYAAAMQYPEGHNLYVSASYSSGYEDPKIKGTWYLRAKLHHPWAADEEPFEDTGKIKGKSGGMGKRGKQADKDWWAKYDPTWTFRSNDSYAEAKVTRPSDNKKFRSASYAPAFTKDVKWVRKRP